MLLRHSSTKGTATPVVRKDVSASPGACCAKATASASHVGPIACSDTASHGSNRACALEGSPRSSCTPCSPTVRFERLSMPLQSVAYAQGHALSSCPVTASHGRRQRSEEISRVAWGHARRDWCRGLVTVRHFCRLLVVPGVHHTSAVAIPFVPACLTILLARFPVVTASHGRRQQDASHTRRAVHVRPIGVLLT